MTESSSATPGLGLVYKALVPMYWCGRVEAEDQSLVVESYVQAEQTLQMLSLTQEHGREGVDDEAERSTELARVEAKVDLMLNLLSRLVMEKATPVKKYNVQLGSQGLLFLAGEGAVLKTDQGLWVELYLDAQFPWPLRLPARVLGPVKEGDEPWIRLAFEQLPEALTEHLDK